MNPRTRGQEKSDLGSPSWAESVEITFYGGAVLLFEVCDEHEQSSNRLLPQAHIFELESEPRRLFPRANEPQLCSMPCGAEKLLEGDKRAMRSLLMGKMLGTSARVP